jgi:hypothetical protein
VGELGGLGHAGISGGRQPGSPLRLSSSGPALILSSCRPRLRRQFRRPCPRLRHPPSGRCSKQISHTPRSPRLPAPIATRGTTFMRSTSGGPVGRQQSSERCSWRRLFRLTRQRKSSGGSSLATRLPFRAGISATPSWVGRQLWSRPPASELGSRGSTSIHWRRGWRAPSSPDSTVRASSATPSACSRACELASPGSTHRQVTARRYRCTTSGCGGSPARSAVSGRCCTAASSWSASAASLGQSCASLERSPSAPIVCGSTFSSRAARPCTAAGGAADWMSGRTAGRASPAPAAE